MSALTLTIALFCVQNSPAGAIEAGLRRNQGLRRKQAPAWTGTTVQDLWNEYGNIFPSRNRNGAAFKWSTFLLERATQMTAARFETLNTGFCPVAASIVTPSDMSRYRVTLQAVTGGGAQKTGFLYYCCWPCVCDTMDFIKVDTKTITLANGVTKQYNWAVIGNPCATQASKDKLFAPYMDPFDHMQETIAQVAPEIQCSGNKLSGATLSDNGYIIMSMLFDNDLAVGAQDGPGFAGACTERANNNYNSGMGLIFRKIASANPITVGSALVAQPPHALASDLKPDIQKLSTSAAADKFVPEECPCMRKRREAAEAALRQAALREKSISPRSSQNSTVSVQQH